VCWLAGCEVKVSFLIALNRASEQERKKNCGKGKTFQDLGSKEKKKSLQSHSFIVLWD